MDRLREAEVLKKFSLYSGEEEAEGARWALCKALCGECGEWIESKAAGEGEKGLGLLESLAAAEAFYQLVLLDGALAPESLSSPEVKLEMGKREEKALKLAEEKRRACGGFLREEGFYFGSVRAYK